MSTPTKLVNDLRRYARTQGWDFDARQGQTSHMVVTLTEPDGRKRQGVISMGRGEIRPLAKRGFLRQLKLDGVKL